MKEIIIKFGLMPAIMLLSAGFCVNAQIIKGIRVPQLDDVQRNSISAISAEDAKGQTIYNIVTDQLQFWNGARWLSVNEMKVGGQYGVVITGSGTDSIGVELSPKERWFYMPGVPVDVSQDATAYPLDLYAIYQQQFAVPVSSSSGSFSIPTYARGDLEYVITGWDSTVFSNPVFDTTANNEGKLTFDIYSANVTAQTYISIVLYVKK